MRYTMRAYAFLLFAGLLLASGCSKDTTERDAFLGTYEVEETCPGATYTYTMVILANPEKRREVFMSNFGNFNTEVKGTVSGNKLEIDDTVLGTNFSGSGALVGDVLVISYAVESFTIMDDCALVGTRQ